MAIAVNRCIKTIAKLWIISFVAALVISCNSIDIVESEGWQLAVKKGCFGCHGLNGVSDNPSFPNLAGQSKLYLRAQLEAFRRIDQPDPKMDLIRQRYNGMMNRKAADLDEGDVDRLINFFSTQSCGFGRHRPVPVIPLKAKACFKCHGEDGISVFPEVPNIAGQKRGYLATQLFAFRKASFGANVAFKVTHEGKARYHHIMTTKASKLSDGDISALSFFFSRLDCRGKIKSEK